MKMPDSIHCLVFTVVVLISCSANGQTIEEASAMFMRKQFDSSYVAAKHIIEKNAAIPDAYVVAGRSLVAMKKYEEATGYLENAKTFPEAKDYSKAWAMCELGWCYYAKGEYNKSKENLVSCIKLNATKNATKSAQFTMIKLGFDKLYDSWITKESTHFRFHFQDTAKLANITRFIHLKEMAFDTINLFFNASLAKKIDYFVWSDTELADSLFHHRLAFSESGLCLTHTDPKHTIGHEMTHSISFNAVRPKKQTQLIAEGVCVCFDGSNRDNIAAIKKNMDSRISISEIWKNDNMIGDEVIYPLGGELLKRLILKFGREKFIQLLADQSYENAEKIYGAELSKVLFKLEGEINPK